MFLFNVERILEKDRFLVTYAEWLSEDRTQWKTIASFIRAKGDTLVRIARNFSTCLPISNRTSKQRCENIIFHTTLILLFIFLNEIQFQHPGQCVILQFESDGQDGIEDSLKMFAENEHDVTTNDVTNNDPSKMLVLEDVIIEENDDDSIIRADDSTNMMEYTYEADIDAHVQG